MSLLGKRLKIRFFTTNTLGSKDSKRKKLRAFVPLSLCGLVFRHPLGKLLVKPQGLFLIVIFFAGFLTTLYVSNEHIFYWWDYAFYKEIADDTSRMFIQNPFQALKAVYFSTWLDYNYYFALPLIPFMELFKYSRLGYIIGLVFVYHIPMLIVSGHIARRIFPSHTYAGWITIFTGALIPAFWASAFRGYPDTGAVLLIAVAIVIYLLDMELKKWRLQLPVIGILCGLAIIFRRHFAYNVASLLFSIGAFLLFFALQRSEKNWRKGLSEFWNVLIKMQIILAFLVLSIVLLAPGLLLNIIYVNYLSLYSSYSLNPFQVFVYFLKTYGVLWFLVVLGFASGIPKIQKVFQLEGENADQKSLCFILLFGVTSVFIWVAIPRQTGTQYMLHVALPILLGISALIVWVIIKPKTLVHWLLTPGIFLLLGYNLWAGLAPVHLVPIPTTLNHPPLYRPDYDEVARLVAYLREIAGGNGSIYIVDSSKLMNDEIIHHAEVSLYGEHTSLRILHSPQIDSRDFYPLAPLLQAEYVVVTTPFQYHLSEDEQKVVKFVFDIFSYQWKIRKDFKKLPEEFHLYDGAVLSVYKRQVPTSLETTLLTFSQMRKYIGRLPGGQPDWILITPSAEASLVYDINGKKHSVTISKDSPSLSFLYTGADPAQYLITGKAKFSDEGCPPVGVSMQVFSLSEPISMLYLKQITSGAGDFVLNIEKTDAIALVLNFQQNTTLSIPLCNPILEWEMSE